MKIAFLSHFDLNLYLFRLPIMKELIKRGNEVYAVCPKGNVFDEFKDYGVNAVEYKIDRGSLNPFKEIETIRNIKKVIKSIKPDILHTFMHKPNIYGNLVFHKNTINTITGLGSFFIYNDLKSKIIRNIIETGYKFTAKSSKKVIFQNSDDLELFINKNIIPREKAVLIKSSGIDTTEWKMEDLGFRIEDLGIKKDKPTVLMIARVIKDKGVEEYIKAAELLKEKANFLYVGDVDKGNKNTFLPDWKNVKFLGFRRDIKELISICDIFVLPSYREGVPRTLLEAASMSKPIVTTNAPGCREVVEDNKNGFLVSVRDYKTLAKKIEILIDNTELREEFGRYSREKAVNDFDIKVVVDKYLKVYEEILSV
ncbi:MULTISPECIES: N,N'-diacetylbacillosaminyl-diphospho-undecaprenol alpha-1,3-N-acetylgalactosaminyltransferase [unclassified Lebetimonas]|uniref:N, N'-diacetylbacillosaminyl-diphospho-undecaprenol alpha-1,3-N-acetylgalactosaminyltransferase n=1 Tax=unclassified Lebetimonas TaxID=2648158 RepID=UPI0004639475|nr:MULTISPECIES: N,N'-diacetylbacillosaminyl-diphospho-undecaprenol alpha-1,3-N-acetylgalactosaminyltransferase [unclassified Lebetimonas]